MKNSNQTYISFFGEISFTHSEETGGTYLENEIFANGDSGASYQYENSSLVVAEYFSKFDGEEWETICTVYYGCVRLNMGATPVQMVDENEVEPVVAVRADFA